MAWNDNLAPDNPAYQIAATNSSRVRVVAGPGTGKSFALKRRVARLLESGIAASRILPVTFTRIAAEDLHRELAGLIVDGADDLVGRTLHSLGLRILRRQNVLESTSRVPRLLNQFEMQPLLYDLTIQFGTKRERSKRIRAYEAAWARLQHEEPGYAQSETDEYFETSLIAWLRFHNAMLIGEIVPELYKYLRDNAAAPEYDLYDHILVDEFQDLNKAEQRVIELLGRNCEICIVGDDDQSIYGFKHANPDGIRNWHQVQPEVDDHALLDCRRCPVRVVQIANSLIGHNQNREDRMLVELPGNGQGEIGIVQYGDLEQEVEGVTGIVSNLIEEQGYDPGEILILAQRKVVGNPIAESIAEAQIPVHSYYSESELDSEKAQERFAMLKMVIDREDRVALRWLLGLGSTSFRTRLYARVRQYSEKVGLSPWSVMEGLANGDINLPYTTVLVTRFGEITNEISEIEAHDEFVDQISAWLPEEIENVDGLQNLVQSSLDECDSLQELLASINTKITQPEIPIEVTEVRIMSLHKSKGLSSPVVIVAGCMEGLLPSHPDQDISPNEQAADLEEQRRLFYVGITRVKADPADNKPGRLILTSCRRMPQASAMGSGIQPAFFRHGFAHMHASRFIQELGPQAPQTQHG